MNMRLRPTKDDTGTVRFLMLLRLTGVIAAAGAALFLVLGLTFGPNGYGSATLLLLAAAFGALIWPCIKATIEELNPPNPDMPMWILPFLGFLFFSALTLLLIVVGTLNLFGAAG